MESGLKQSKNELGWADFRITDYNQIHKWWELVMSAYLMVSLHSKKLNSAQKLGNDTAHPNLDKIISKFATHEWWDTGGWKNLLNNLRLIIQAIYFLQSTQTVVGCLFYSAIIFWFFAAYRFHELL